MVPDSNAVAALLQWKESHDDRCKERFEANSRDLADIKAGVHDLTVEMKHTVKNLHTLSESISARINAVATAAGEDIALVNRRIDDQKIWSLSGLVAALSSLVVWLASHLWVAK